MFSNKSILFALAFAHAAAAATHDVKVGVNGLSFTPNVTTAAKGDTVVFHFYPGHHDVVEGNFASPCTFANGGFFSGYIDSTSGAASDVFVVTIKDTNPIWYYCSPHCESGMVAVINPPSSGNTLDKFLAGARSAQGSTTPAAVEGGVVEAANAVSSSTSPSTSSSASPSASSSSASSVATSASSTSTSSTASESAAQSSATASAPSTGSSSTAQTAGTTQASSTSTTSASASAKPNGAVAMSVQSVVGGGVFALVTLVVLLTGLI